jgi:hypothetical protein
MRLVAHDAVQHAGRPIEYSFGVEERVRPRGRGVSYPRAARCLRVGASRRQTDRPRLRHEGADSSERVHRAVRPAHDGPRAVDVIAPMDECGSHDRARKRLRPKQGLDLSERVRLQRRAAHASCACIGVSDDGRCAPGRATESRGTAAPATRHKSSACGVSARKRRWGGR